MELPNTFSYDNWNIKYALSSPHPTPYRTVVFIHGTPWSSAVFRPIAKALISRTGYRVLLYDLPGYGQSQQHGPQSPHPQIGNSRNFKGRTSVGAQAEALASLLLHLKLDGKEGREAPAVIAHDIAGTIALRAHLILGCQFQSLLLLDTNTVLPWGDGSYKLVRSEPNVFCGLPLNIFAAVVRSVIKSACCQPMSAEWENTLADPWIGITPNESRAEKKRGNFVRQIAQANDADVQEMLDGNMYGRVRCPVNIMWGEQDQWIPREKMNSLAMMLGQQLKDFVVVPEAGHLLMVDQPERFAVEVLDWLAQQEALAQRQIGIKQEE